MEKFVNTENAERFVTLVKQRDAIDKILLSDELSIRISQDIYSKLMKAANVHSDNHFLVDPVHTVVNTHLVNELKAARDAIQEEIIDLIMVYKTDRNDAIDVDELIDTFNKIDNSCHMPFDIQGKIDCSLERLKRYKEASSVSSNS